MDEQNHKKRVKENLIPIEYNEYSQVIRETMSTLSSKVVVVMGDNISITINSWNNVRKEDKN